MSKILYRFIIKPEDSPTSALPASSEFATEQVDAAALWKACVIKYTPLGAYTRGSYDVKAALNNCNSLV